MTSVIRRAALITRTFNLFTTAQSRLTISWPSLFVKV